MAKHKQYDLIVIGAGTGGLTAAEVAARLGARVALIESSNRLGGECLHSGCVPSKALIHAARGVTAARKYAESIDGEQAFVKAMEGVRASIAHIEHAHDNDAYYQKMGVDVFHAKAVFTGKRSIQLDDNTTLTAKKIIIATGSKPLVPEIPGIDSVHYLTNETIFQLEQLPKSMTIIGGGPIGCELGQALAAFGTYVTILSNTDKLLPRDEPEASLAVLQSFTNHPNITVVLNAKTSQVSSKNGITVHYDADESTQITSEVLLIATGRKANTNLQLEAAGIACNERQISTNDKLQTSNKAVYAIGDVAGGPNFTHIATDHASLAVQNALLGLGKQKRNLDELPWSTFTSPEIARIGADEASLQSSKTAYQKYVLNFSDVDKAITDHEEGLIKIVTSPKGFILGATIIGGPASEILSMLTVAKKQGVTLQKLGETLQPYPTYAFGIKLFASDLSLQKYETGLNAKLVRFIRKLR